MRSVDCGNNAFDLQLMPSQHVRGKKRQYRVKYLQVTDSRTATPSL